MTTFKIMGTEDRLRGVLNKTGLNVRGGHTVVEVAEDKARVNPRANVISRADAERIFGVLTEEYKFTALDTSVAEKPVRVTTFKPDTQTELVFIPQIAGG